jgi:hypothetical protein
VVAVSTVTMNGWYEPTYHWFSYATLLHIAQAEAWADALAAELGADVAVSAHRAADRGPSRTRCWSGMTTSAAAPNG